jgi:hypothetical protein
MLSDLTAHRYQVSGRVLRASASVSTKPELPPKWYVSSTSTSLVFAQLQCVKRCKDDL